jgi:hypothetical protein
MGLVADVELAGAFEQRGLNMRDGEGWPTVRRPAK